MALLFAGQIASAANISKSYFIENKGQWDNRAQFSARAHGLNAWIGAGEIICDFHSIAPEKKSNGKLFSAKPENAERPTKKGSVVKMALKGAFRAPEIVGEGKLAAYHNYFIGDDPEKWASGVSLYERVRMKNVYDGIDLALYFEGGSLRYDFIVNPGGEPGEVSLAFEGAEKVETTPSGELLLQTRVGVVEHQKLFAYQNVEGRRRKVSCKFVENGGEIKFKTGEYDRSKPLIIDPLIYSTFIGSTNNDFPFAIQLDAQGAVYVAGQTWLGDYPTTTGAYEETYSGGGSDIFVTKLNADGDELAYSTFVGGEVSEDARSIELCSGGEIIVGGVSSSDDFPTTSGAFDEEHNGGDDGVVFKLSAEGDSLEYSTFIGGSGADKTLGIRIDSGENVYFAGESKSNDFPATSGAFDESYNGETDAIFGKLNSGGATLAFASYLGGSGKDAALDVELDDAGSIFAGGYTESSDFPTTSGAYDETYGEMKDLFAAKFNSNGSQAEYSTYIGGSDDETAYCLALDDSGALFLAGDTWSSDYPTTSGAFDETYNDTDDAFVTKLNSNGTGLVFSTFLGGANLEIAYDILVDGIGDVYLAGITWSDDFPVAGSPYQSDYAEGWDAFATKIYADGESLFYSTYLGGSNEDFAQGIAADARGNIYIVGRTYSDDFPTSNGAYDETHNGEYDMFVSKMFIGVNLVEPTLISPEDETEGALLQIDFDFSDVDFADGYSIAIARDDQFTDIVYESATLTQSSFSLPEGYLEYENTYYWKARSRAGTQNGPWSETWSFSTADVVPPALVYPGYNELNVPLEPLFDWEDVAIADGYFFEISENRSFTNIVFESGEISESEYRLESGYLKYAADYYWRAKTKADEVLSDWSASSRFVAEAVPIPVLIYPENNSTITFLTPVFDWNDIPQIDSYAIQIASDSEFSNIIIQAGSLQSSQFQVGEGTLNAYEDYYWRVRGKSGEFDGEWSAGNKFSTTPPSYPEIYLTEQTINYLTTPAWPQSYDFEIKAEIVDDVEPYVETVTLFYKYVFMPYYSSAAMTETEGVYSANIPTSSVFYPGVVFYIYATDGQVYSTSPAQDPQTRPYNIAVSDNLLPVVELVNEPNITSENLNEPMEIIAKATDNSDFVENVDLYYRKIGDDAFLTLPMSETSEADEYSAYIPGDFVTIAGLQFYVQAKDNYEFRNSYPTVYTLEYSQTQPPDLLEPVDGSSVYTLAPKIDWSDVSGADLYGVEIAEDAEFQNVVYSSTFSDAQSQFYLPSGYLNRSATYYWRAYAQIEDSRSAWSEPNDFSTDQAPEYTKMEKWGIPSYFKGINVHPYSYEEGRFLDEQDFIDIKNMGANLVIINAYGFLDEDPPYSEAQNQSGGSATLTQREVLDDMVDYAKSAGLHYVISVWTGPGRYSTEGEDSGPVYSTIWTVDAEQRLYGGMLRDMANRYLPDTLFAGVNAINKPNPFSTDALGDSPAELQARLDGGQIDLAAIYELLIDSVRQADRELPVLVENAGWSDPNYFELLDAQSDENVVYSVQMFDPGDYCKAAASSATYPGEYFNNRLQSQADYDKEFIDEQVFAPVAAFQSANPAPIIAAAFGMKNPQIGGATYLDDVADIAYMKGWSFCFYDYIQTENYNYWKFDSETGSQYAATIETNLDKGITPPALAAPADATTDAGFTPEFSWTYPVAADSYRLQISDDAEFSNIIIDANNINALQYTLPAGTLQPSTTYYWRVSAKIGGFISDRSATWSFSTGDALPTQDISLSTGWNMISSYIEPQQTAMSSIFQDLSSSQLYLALDNRNRIYFHADASGNLTNWESSQGYRTYMFQSADLTVQGNQISPENASINLATGWNMIAYLRTTAMSPATAFAGLNSSQLYLVLDNRNRIYFHADGSGNLTALEPGQGYKLYMFGAAQQTYPANSGGKAAFHDSPRFPEPEYLRCEIEPTGSAAVVLLETDEYYDGWEVGAYSGDILIGSGKVFRGKAVLPVWGDDSMTSRKEAAKGGEPIILKAYNPAEDMFYRVEAGRVYEISKDKYSDGVYFAEDEIYSVSAKIEANAADGFDFLVKPNPAGDFAVLQAVSSEPVSISIYDARGELAASRVEISQKGFSQSAALDFGALPSGVYTIVVKSGGEVKTKKIVIIH